MHQPRPKTFLLIPYFLLPLASSAALPPPERTSASASASADGGGWTSTCEGKAVTAAGVLSGNCFRRSRQGHGQVRSRLDLDHCYGFGPDDDKAHEQDDGNFTASCYNCNYSFQFGGGIVECTCTAHNGLPVRADLRTDNIVTNNDGYLQCYGHVAEPC